MNIIDVRQFVTQIVGFLLVLWILGKYAWPPVLGFIEERQKKIAGDLEHARVENERAVKLRTELDQGGRAEGRDAAPAAPAGRDRDGAREGHAVAQARSRAPDRGCHGKDPA